MMDLKSVHICVLLQPWQGTKYCLSRVCMQLRNQMSRLRDEQQGRRRIYEATESQTDRITMLAVHFKRGMLLEKRQTVRD